MDFTHPGWYDSSGHQVETQMLFLCASAQPKTIVLLSYNRFRIHNDRRLALAAEGPSPPPALGSGVAGLIST